MIDANGVRRSCEIVLRSAVRSSSVRRSTSALFASSRRRVPDALAELRRDGRQQMVLYLGEVGATLTGHEEEGAYTALTRGNGYYVQSLRNVERRGRPCVRDGAYPTRSWGAY